jgi:hypothetical protein
VTQSRSDDGSGALVGALTARQAIREPNVDPQQPSGFAGRLVAGAATVLPQCGPATHASKRVARASGAPERLTAAGREKGAVALGAGAAGVGVCHGW